ncbi:hypothetical protein ACJX0J_028629, partial [Zea mays]
IDIEILVFISNININKHIKNLYIQQYSVYLHALSVIFYSYFIINVVELLNLPMKAVQHCQEVTTHIEIGTGIQDAWFTATIPLTVERKPTLLCTITQWSPLYHFYSFPQWSPLSLHMITPNINFLAQIYFLTCIM